MFEKSLLQRRFLAGGSNRLSLVESIIIVAWYLMSSDSDCIYIDIFFRRSTEFVVRYFNKNIFYLKIYIFFRFHKIFYIYYFFTHKTI